MAGEGASNILEYSSNNLQYPGDFRVSNITLISPYGYTAGITSNVTQLNIYEDMYQNCLTGDITFLDTEDIVNVLPIVGNEYLAFKIRTPLESQYEEGEYDFTNVRMAVYKVISRVRINSRTQEIKLGFTSPENIRNQNIKISKAFNGPYDAAVAVIFKNSDYLNSKRKLYIQPTLDSFKFVATNKRPLDIINMIAERAVPTTRSAPAYLFYENGQGFHFRSMDSFFYIIKSGHKIEKHPAMFEYFPDTVEARGTVNVRENPKSYMRLVDKYSFSQLPDLIKSQHMGTYASKLITHDAFNKTFKTRIHNYIDEYADFPHLEGEDLTKQVLGATSYTGYKGLIAKSHYDPSDVTTSNTKLTQARTRYNMISDYSDARVMVASNTANIHDSNMAEGYRIDESLQRRQSSLQLFKTLEMILEVPGNTHISTGHIIRVNVPRSGGDKKGTPADDNDRNHSGRWLITAIRHSFTFAPTKMHKSVITCIKETYQKSLTNNVDMFQMTQKDEGDAVSIRDNSIYSREIPTFDGIGGIDLLNKHLTAFLSDNDFLTKYGQTKQQVEDAIKALSDNEFLAKYGETKKLLGDTVNALTNNEFLTKYGETKQKVTDAIGTFIGVRGMNIQGIDMRKLTDLNFLVKYGNTKKKIEDTVGAFTGNVKKYSTLLQKHKNRISGVLKTKERVMSKINRIKSRISRFF